MPSARPRIPHRPPRRCTTHQPELRPARGGAAAGSETGAGRGEERNRRHHMEDGARDATGQRDTGATEANRRPEGPWHTEAGQAMTGWGIEHPRGHEGSLRTCGVSDIEQFPGPTRPNGVQPRRCCDRINTVAILEEEGAIMARHQVTIKGFTYRPQGDRDQPGRHCRLDQ